MSYHIYKLLDQDEMLVQYLHLIVYQNVNQNVLK